MSTTARSPAARTANDQVMLVGSLTGLRAVAAAVVFFYHLRNVGYVSGGPQAVLTTLFDGGASAVSLFFILSGFVLGWSHRPGMPIASTWWNRLLRIYPLHLVAVGLAVIVAATVYPGIRTTEMNAGIANLFLLSAWRAQWWQAGNPVSWSLVCEAFFYALFPVLIRALLRLGRTAIVAVAVFCVAWVWTAPTALAVITPTISSFSNPIARLPEFVLGVTLAVLMRHHGWAGARLFVALPLALIGYVAALNVGGTPYAMAACTVVGFALLISALARLDVSGHSTVLNSRAMIALGEMSFAFYLLHLLALQAVIGMLPQLRADTLAAAVAVLGVIMVTNAAAAGLHYGIERPLVRAFRWRRAASGDQTTTPTP